MKFDQFMSNCGLKTSFRPFCVCRELSTTSIGSRKAIKICPKQHAVLLRILFTGDSVKIKKGLGLVSRPHFSYNFFIKKNYFVILHRLAKFYYQTVFFQVIQ